MWTPDIDMEYRHTCSQNTDTHLKMIAGKQQYTQFLRAWLYSGVTLFTILQVLDLVWETSLINLTTKPCFSKPCYFPAPSIRVKYTEECTKDTRSHSQHSKYAAI